MERAELSEALRAWRGPDHSGQSLARTFIAEVQPEKFMTAFADAVAGSGEIFLGNPAWGETERASWDALRTAGVGTVPEAGFPLGWLGIPTGGTSGQLKFARHDHETLSAAVRGFTQHFGLTQVNAVGVLPLYHVSGLMAWLRCALTGGTYWAWDWKALEGGGRPVLPARAEGWLLSLVPTQLERLLSSDGAVAWLRQFRIIFIGGAPARPDLLEQAAALRLPLSLGYGMTETAAMVTALRPEDFLAGARHSGAALPHATLKLGSDGVIKIESASLFRGYYPAWREVAAFETTDAGVQPAPGQWQILGRRDAMIITGGEKVSPVEVEAVLRGSGELRDVVVIGVPDAEWGQRVVAAYPDSERPNLAKLAAVITQLLAPAQRPKQFVPLGSWPMATVGKVNRAAVAELVSRALSAS